jgi:hypothetical protein
MIKAYTTEESINCCTKYIRDGRAIGLPIPHHEGITLGIGCTGRKVRTDVEYETVQQAHHSVLHQLVVMERYVEESWTRSAPLKTEIARRHGSRNSTRSISQCESKSKTYPM